MREKLRSEWLLDLITLDTVKNFTRAERILQTSQSTLSRRIQAFEAWTGTSLIDRDVTPIALTESGQRMLKFARDHHVEISQVKAEIDALKKRQEQQHLAVPFALATSRLTGWLNAWQLDHFKGLAVRVGSVPDCARAVDAEEVDVAICYELHNDPLRLDSSRFERVVIEHDMTRPYAADSLIAAGRASFPGSTKRPMSLITYTPDSFSLRAFQSVLKNAPSTLMGESVLSVALSDLQAELAVKGHGVAWLSDSTAQQPGREMLVPLGGGKWDVPVEVVAYRCKGKVRRSRSDLWERIRSAADPV